MKRFESILCVCLAALAVSACSSVSRSADREGRPAPASQAAPAPADEPEPELALGYTPGDAPTERLIARAQEAVRTHPQDPEAHVQLAFAMLRRRRETSDPSYMLYAEDAMRSARARAEDDPRVLMLRALIAQDRHAFRDARAVAERLVQVDPDGPTGYILLGDSHLELGDYEQAVAAYQHALDLRPDLRSYNRGAYLRWLHGDPGGAIELIEVAIDSGSARDPESVAWCYVDLGWIYQHQGDGRRAAAAADRALELVPDYLPALGLKARARMIEGRTADAISLLQLVVARNPSSGDLLLLSELLDAAGRRDDARAQRAAAERLAEADPRPLALYYARHGQQTARALRLAERELRSRAGIEAHDAHAMALLRAGRTAEASRALDRALALGTPDASFHLHRALIQLAEGDRGAAQASLDHALQMNPTADPLLVAELRDRLSAGG